MASIKTLRSVNSAVDVLKCLSDGTHTLSGVSKTLKLSKSNVYRLLQTLGTAGMVTQDPRSKQYYLGYMAAKIAYPLINSHEILLTSARQEIQRLRDISRETVILYVLNGKQIICLEELPGLYGVKLTVGKGAQIPLYVGSAALVLLSFYDDGDIRKLLENTELTAFTPNTITDKAVLLKKVKEARKQGWAMSYATYTAGAVSIAVPVKNYIMPLAVTILGLESRFGDMMTSMLPELQKSAERISNGIFKERFW